MGLSFGEIFLLVIVGIIVVGPKNLPPMMRTAGQWVARLRRMSSDLRSQSGIDDLLRQEGLDQHIHELRSLSRFNVVETLMAPAAGAARVPLDQVSARPEPRRNKAFELRSQEPLREREYPVVGCDACGALEEDPTAPVTMGPQAAANSGPAEPGPTPLLLAPPPDPYIEVEALPEADVIEDLQAEATEQAPEAKAPEAQAAEAKAPVPTSQEPS